MKFIRLVIFLLAIIMVWSPMRSCTIFCAIDSLGHVWAGNNEDARFSLGNKIGIVSKTDSTLGFVWFYYTNNGYAQGGSNEAGLFYDLNSVDASEIEGC